MAVLAGVPESASAGGVVLGDGVPVAVAEAAAELVAAAGEVVAGLEAVVEPDAVEGGDEAACAGGLAAAVLEVDAVLVLDAELEDAAELTAGAEDVFDAPLGAAALDVAAPAPLGAVVLEEVDFAAIDFVAAVDGATPVPLVEAAASDVAAPVVPLAPDEEPSSPQAANASITKPNTTQRFINLLAVNRTGGKQSGEMKGSAGRWDHARKAGPRARALDTLRASRLNDAGAFPTATPLS